MLGLTVHRSKLLASVLKAAGPAPLLHGTQAHPNPLAAPQLHYSQSAPDRGGVLEAADDGMRPPSLLARSHSAPRQRAQPPSMLTELMTALTAFYR